jgi:hypothetical protein
MTMTDKLMLQLHQEMERKGLNHLANNDEELMDFCIAYVIANIDEIAILWNDDEVQEVCNEQ